MKHAPAHIQAIIFFSTLFLAHTNMQANLCGDISIHDEISCSKLEIIENRVDDLQSFDTIITTTNIFDGYTISTPGVYYLGESGTKTTAGNAITITADNVVLDLNNHTITMVSTFAAISISGTQNNITIKNGSIKTDANGIDAIGTITQLTILDMVISKNSSPIANSIGINLDTNVSNVLIARCQVQGLDAQFNISASYCTLNDCIGRNGLSTGSLQYAFGIFGADGIILNNCIGTNCPTQGFRVSTNCEFNNSNAIGNTGSGFWLTPDSTGCSFNNCISDSNTARGFLLDGGTSTLKCCVAINNTINGFAIANSSAENILCNCLATQTTSGNGFLITSSAENQLIECKASNNTGDGFALNGSANSNIVYQCVATGNTSADGFCISGTANKNLISECVATGNTSIGFKADTSTVDNKIVHSRAMGNATGFSDTGTTNLFANNCSYGSTTADYSGITFDSVIDSTTAYWENIGA
jgi:hypothetical protein